MKRSQKIRIYPNNKQRTFLSKHCGCARLAYNICLNKWDEDYKNNIAKHNYYSIKKWFNQYKKENFSFIYEVSKWCVEAAIKDLDFSFQNFYKKHAKHPVFHSKKHKQSFRIDGSVIKIEGNYLILPKKLKLKLSENLRWLPLKIYNVTVSYIAGKWFASINMEVPDTDSEKQVIGKVGIDIGLKQALVCSDGQVFENPKIEIKFRQRLRWLQKELSRRKKGGRNWKKTVSKIQNLYWKISNYRQDWIHKTTAALTKQYPIICLEDLNVSGMAKNHKLAKAILDVSFAEIRRQFEYKAKEVWFVNRFDPTSKTCSQCNFVQDMPLNKRQFTCPECGQNIDRDLNAALNILRWATPLKPVARNSSSLEQEINTKIA